MNSEPDARLQESHIFAEKEKEKKGRMKKEK